MSTRSPAAHFRVGNLVTYVAILSALVACVFTTGPSSRALAGAALAIAALADLFDGKFARLFSMTEEQKKFGVQIDSLSDVLSFGLAPVVVLSRVMDVSGTPRVILAACGLAYLICAVTRLAFYNVTESEVSGFIGVPTTLLGLFWSAWLLGVPSFTPTCVALILGGASMVAPLKIPRPGVAAFVMLTLGAIGLAIAHLIR